MLVAQLYPTLCEPMGMADQAPLSMEFFKQEYWVGSCCFSGDLLAHGLNLGPPAVVDSSAGQYWEDSEPEHYSSLGIIEHTSDLGQVTFS